MLLKAHSAALFRLTKGPLEARGSQFFISRTFAPWLQAFLAPTGSEALPAYNLLPGTTVVQLFCVPMGPSKDPRRVMTPEIHNQVPGLNQ